MSTVMGPRAHVKHVCHSCSCKPHHSDALPLVGLGDTEVRAAATEVEALWMLGITQISCGSNHSAALTATGTVLTWGRGKYGQLGLGGWDNALRPRTITFPSHTRIVQVIQCPLPLGLPLASESEVRPSRVLGVAFGELQLRFKVLRASRVVGSHASCSLDLTGPLMDHWVPSVDHWDPLMYHWDFQASGLGWLCRWPVEVTTPLQLEQKGRSSAGAEAPGGKPGTEIWRICVLLVAFRR